MFGRNTIVFVVSSAHSGSTLLDLLLGSHSHCTSLGEFKHIGEKLDSGGSICEICDRSCPQWERFEAEVRPPSYHDCAFKVLKTSLLIDSSKDLHWIKESIRHTSADTKIVRILREAQGSLVKRKRKAGEITEQAVLEWVRYNRKIDLYMNTFNDENKITVKYEDLCSNIDSTLLEICRFLEIEYHGKMKSFWEKRHHCVAGNSKPIALVKLYHGTTTVDRLHPDVQQFVDNHGFKIANDKRFEVDLASTDMATIV